MDPTDGTRSRAAGRLTLASAAFAHAVVLLAGAHVVAQGPADPPGAETETTAGSERSEEADDDSAAFTLRPHRKNYFLFIARNDEPFQNRALGFVVDEEEVKFQFSVRYDLWSSERNRLAFAYTNQSFWQVYNGDASSPFRTTDHEPELFFERDSPEDLRRFRIGAAHESNGEGGALSRSWNRLVVEMLFYSSADGPWDRPFQRPEKVPRSKREEWLQEVRQDRYWRISIKAWENVDHDETGNPDIDGYMGLFEASGDLVLGRHQISLLVRHSLGLFDDLHRGAAQLDYSLAFTNRVRGIVQLFNGYGESLLDYDQNATRVGFGLQLSP